MDYMNHLYGRSTKIVKEFDRGTIHKIETREHKICYVTVYPIFAGVNIMFNDIHATKLDVPRDCPDDGIQRYELNHCREGKFETILRDGTNIYLEAGDFAINPFSNYSQGSRFPIGHYHGITICITPSELDREAGILQKCFCINYEQILEDLCCKNTLFLKRATPEMEHIFHEMYHVPEAIAIPYLKVKLQELFLYLCTLQRQISFNPREYFKKTNVDIIKGLHQFVVKNSEHTYTYEQLSSLFHIRQTTMKSCYKSVYGRTIHESIREARLRKGIDLLKNSSRSITEIALEIGYSSHAKFSEAFKKSFNLSPSEYKKIVASSDTDRLIGEE